MVTMAGVKTYPIRRLILFIIDISNGPLFYSFSPVFTVNITS